MTKSSYPKLRSNQPACSKFQFLLTHRRNFEFKKIEASEIFNIHKKLFKHIMLHLSKAIISSKLFLVAAKTIM